MQYGTGTRWGALAFALLFLSSSAGAEEMLPAAAEPKPAAEAKPATEPKHGTTPETAPAPHTDTESILAKESQDCEHGKFFFLADYLLLQPRRRAQDFAIVDVSPDGLPQGSVQSVLWDTNSGFRAGGGYQFPSHWDAGIYYTYFFTGNERTVFAPPGGNLYATLTHPAITDAVDSAFAQSGLKYQVLDVEFGRRIEEGESFSLWIGGGGRFAWIKQSLLAVYDGQSAYEATVSSPLNFSGAGLRVGAQGDWKLGHGLGFYGRAFGSLLAGNIHSRLIETANDGSSSVVDVSDHYRKVVPVAEIGLGVFWQRENWRALVGYEFINWFNLVDSPDFTSEISNKLNYRTSDLSLDGLRIGLQFDF